MAPVIVFGHVGSSLLCDVLADKGVAVARNNSQDRGDLYRLFYFRLANCKRSQQGSNYQPPHPRDLRANSLLRMLRSRFTTTDRKLRTGVHTPVSHADAAIGVLVTVRVRENNTDVAGASCSI
jgi:hypothetical protein